MYGFIVLGIHVESVLLSLFWFSVFLHCVLIQSLCCDLCDGGVPHTSMCACIFWVTYKVRSSVVCMEVMIIWGWVGNMHAYGHSSFDGHG